MPILEALYQLASDRSELGGASMPVGLSAGTLDVLLRFGTEAPSLCILSGEFLASEFPAEQFDQGWRPPTVQRAEKEARAGEDHWGVRGGLGGT
ncbi:MAG: hypothetical protein ACM3MF_06590 [Anaerolineae bacterium]